MTLAVNVEGLAADLRNERDRWCVWRDVNGKKVPFQVARPDDEAKVNDESHWGAFDDARGVYEAGGFDGLGFRLGSGFAGVDLDDCRDPETGALTPKAQAIVNEFNSYTEVSPSGEGVKIFVKAWLGKNHPKAGCEIYGGRRYFCVTGQHLEGTPTTVEERGGQLDALIAREFKDDDRAERTAPRDSKKPATRQLTKGERDNSLTRLAGRLRRAGFDDDAMAAALWKHNLRYCQPPLERRDVERVAHSIGRKRSGDVEFIAFTSGARTGQIVADNQHNIRLALAKLGLTFRYNAFANTALVTHDGATQPLDDAVLNRAWLQLDEVFGFRPPIEFFQIVVGDLARRDSFHPVRDYLDALTWDRTPRIDTWLSTYGGACDTDYTRAVGSIFLVAAVRRVRTAGCKFDELLILESEQGLLKSQALRALCPEDESWFSDDLPLGVDAKQVIERTAGKWLIEASELQGYTNAEIDRLKGMLARQVDGPVRLAYGRLSVEVPRQFVMAGTTNKLTEYLRDSTGNRRFWPVRCQRFDLDALRRDRDQIWAEAACRESAAGSIRLPENLWSVAAAEQEARREIDPWEELLDDRVAGGFEREAILVEELWRALGDAGNFRKRNDASRLSQIMQRRGFTRKKKVDVTFLDRNGQAPLVEAGGEKRRAWAWIREGKDPASIEVQMSVPAGQQETPW